MTEWKTEYMYTCDCGHSSWTTEEKEGETCSKCEKKLNVVATKKPLFISKSF